MRLIDADGLKEDFSWSEVCRLSLKEIKQYIDDAPTVEERLQGKWIPEYPITYTCSICKVEALDVNEYPYKSNYCPNCGADMRGVQNEVD